jgi:sec-independent protein translocase protein TatA
MASGILSPTHLLVVLIVALIVLGPKRLPGAGKALGQGLREFKDSISGNETAQLSTAAVLPGMSEVATPEPAAAVVQASAPETVAETV